MIIDNNTRTRINFKVGSKGRVSVDISHEMNNVSKEKVLTEATKLLDSAMIIAKERTKQNGNATN